MVTMLLASSYENIDTKAHQSMLSVPYLELVDEHCNEQGYSHVVERHTLEMKQPKLRESLESHPTRVSPPGLIPRYYIAGVSIAWEAIAGEYFAVRVAGRLISRELILRLFIKYPIRF